VARTAREEIRDRALAIIASHPQGIRWADLVRKIRSELPDVPKGTVVGNVWNIHTIYPKKVAKPSRGLFVPVGGEGGEVDTPAAPPSAPEENFYEPFAEYLVNDLEEATVAKPLGGAALKHKWGTPDVIGVYKAVPSNLVKFDPEVLSGELKVNEKESITAFGQAVAYRLFSHKVYMAMPKTLPEDDLARLEALSILFGIGLVTFNPVEDAPDFNIRVRAQRLTPDMFYVNEFAGRLAQYDKKLLDGLFA
jgi:hypothetical protein